MSEFQEVVKEGANTAWKRIKQFFLYLTLALVVGGGLYLWVVSWTYSEGTRAGYLIKVSHKGVVFKTYEGQLNLGGFQTDAQSGVVGNIWEFSTSKRAIYDQLQELEGTKVKLHYKQRYKSMPWQGKTEYFIYKVEQVE